MLQVGVSSTQALILLVDYGCEEAVVIDQTLSVSQEAWMSISPACSLYQQDYFLHHGGESTV